MQTRDRIFGRVPVSAPDRPTFVIRHDRHRFSAAIRQVPLQNDASGDNTREPAPDPGFASAQPALTGTGEVTPEGQEGKSARFPDIVLPSVGVPPQTDAISSTLAYQSKISQAGTVDPGDFGTTNPQYRLLQPHADLKDQTYFLTGTVDAQINYQVDAGGRTDIASENDPGITQNNYPDVVKDLTPSPAAVNEPGRKLFKNQPPRQRFWAQDLTIKHELFHADEDVKFGREGTTVAQNWLNRQTAQSFDDVGKLLQPAIDMVSATVRTRMAYPAREERAYNAGAAAYTARAQAIKQKGDAKGYVPPPAPKAPATPPNPAPAPKANSPG
jgi:hypothetical protein